VNFVLHKPLSALNASRCFNAALGFMLRERRRYFRHPVTIPVTLLVEDKQLKADSTDLSEGGIALRIRQALPKNAAPRLQFTLPETNITFDVETEVAWADIKGRVGLRFLKLPESSLQRLEGWLNAQTEKSGGAKESTVR
jgi:c-di-GMP-binding flagellar brake protein YcgR